MIRGLGIKQRIPMGIKNVLKARLFRWTLQHQTRKIRRKYQRCIFFISTPTHGNLGDQAIVYAQYKLISDMGMGKQILEITAKQYEIYKKKIVKCVKSKDVIVIDGGGNLGTLWVNVEYKIRDIIKKFPDNKILIFPNTIFYHKNEMGQYELQQSISIYGTHKNLHILAREKGSYEIMKQAYQNIDILLTPDIVLYLQQEQFDFNRKDVLICMRTDHEKCVSEKEIEKIEQLLGDKNIVYHYTSTIIDRAISKENREMELMKKWMEFSQSKLVITDRLHGMIFAAITGTPCIAFDNVSGKVKGVYQWIQYLPYIKFCRDEELMGSYIDELMLMDSQQFSNFKMYQNFEEIKERLK